MRWVEKTKLDGHVPTCLSAKPCLSRGDDPDLFGRDGDTLSKVAAGVFGEVLVQEAGPLSMYSTRSKLWGRLELWALDGGCWSSAGLVGSVADKAISYPSEAARAVYRAWKVRALV